MGWIALFAAAVALGGLLFARPGRIAALGAGVALLLCTAAAFAVNFDRHGFDLVVPLACAIVGAGLLQLARKTGGRAGSRWALRLSLAFAPGLLLAGLVVTLHEIGDVVVLRILDEQGSAQETRLIVVDRAGATWVAAGSGGKRWFGRLVRQPRIEIVRGGVTHCAVAVPVYEPSTREAVLRTLDRSHVISRLSKALGATLFYREEDAPEEAAIAIRLDPCTPGAGP
jgi:hypothetical protein